MSTMRTYQLERPELTETVTVHVSDDGYVRLTVDSLDHMLTHLGFVRTDKETVNG